MAWLAASRRGTNAILHPRHAGEIAEVVNAAPSVDGSIAVRRTSHTIGVSSQSLGPLGGADAVLYSISRADRHLTPGEAKAIARLIFDIAAPRGAVWELVRGGYDVFHLIVRAAPRATPVRVVRPEPLALPDSGARP
jgi:hypothetical protein